MQQVTRKEDDTVVTRRDIDRVGRLPSRMRAANDVGAALAPYASSPGYATAAGLRAAVRMLVAAEDVA